MLTCFKSVIRRPIQHVLLVLFLGIVSFGFITHIAEYLAVTQAVDELSGYYKAIGYLNSDDGDVTDGARFLQGNELIAINDVQRGCSGTLHGLYNPDIDGYSSNMSEYPVSVSEIFVLGELTEKEHHFSNGVVDGDQERYTLNLHVSERLYGYPDYVSEGDNITVSYYPDENVPGLEAAFDALQPNTTYAVKAYYTGSTTFSLRQAIPGDDWFLPATDSRIDEVVKADAAQEINRHRLYIDGTRDMSSLPFTQETSHDGYLVDGRWLTAVDNDTQNPVCVILEGFAETRGLSVGDSLTISLHDEHLSWGYYTEETVVDEADFIDDSTTTFTIVGVFNRTLYTQNFFTPSSQGLLVYVPNSCIPAEYDASRNDFEFVFDVGYSFVLNHPDNQDVFLQQYRKQLEDMGYTVHFIDNGWNAFSTSAKSLARSTTFSTAMFAVIHLLTLVLAAVFYFKLHQKEFSIARALGVSSARVIRWHLVPVMLLGIMGIGVGSVLGWHRALGQIQVTLSALIHDGQELNVQLSAGIPVLLCMMSWIVLGVTAFVCYATLSRHSVMDILYETRKNRGATRKTDISPDSADTLGASLTAADVAETPDTSAPVQPAKHTLPYRTRFSYLARFTRRHVFRSKGRTFLTLAVAIIFILALGWIQRSIDRAEQSIIDAYESVSVEAEILKRDSLNQAKQPGFISSSTVDAILSTGFVKESELVVNATDAKLIRILEDTRVMSAFTLCGITNANHLNRETRNVVLSSAGDGTITYQDGWDASMFEADYDLETTPCPVVIPEAVLTSQDISFGDELTLDAGLQEMTVVVRGSYTGQFDGLGHPPANRSLVLMPHSSMRTLYDGRELFYSIAKYVIEPTMNRELGTFRVATEQIVENDTKSHLAIRLVIWDEELRQVIEPMDKNLTLMKLFYPIAQLAVIVATGIITLLSLMQKTKTAFLLHILGIPSRTVQVVLGSEQVLLGIIGSIIGTLVIIASGNWSVRTVPCVLVYLLGLTIGTVAGSISLTRNQNHA